MQTTVPGSTRYHATRPILQAGRIRHLRITDLRNPILRKPRMNRTRQETHYGSGSARPPMEAPQTLPAPAAVRRRGPGHPGQPGTVARSGYRGVVAVSDRPEVRPVPPL